MTKVTRPDLNYGSSPNNAAFSPSCMTFLCSLAQNGNILADFEENVVLFPSNTQQVCCISFSLTHTD